MCGQQGFPNKALHGVIFMIVLIKCYVLLILLIIGAKAQNYDFFNATTVEVGCSASTILMFECVKRCQHNNKFIFVYDQVEYST